MLQHTSVLQFRVRCWVGVLHRLCGPGLGLRDRWLWSLSHSLEGSDPEDPELECLTLPTCVCVWCCCWPDKLVSQYIQTMERDWEVQRPHFLGHTLLDAFPWTTISTIKFKEIHQFQNVCRLNTTSGMCVCFWGLNMLKGQKKQWLVYHPAVTFPHILTSSIYVIHTLTHTEPNTG